jgi:hypothetical protein
MCTHLKMIQIKYMQIIVVPGEGYKQNQIFRSEMSYSGTDLQHHQFNLFFFVDDQQ